MGLLDLLGVPWNTDVIKMMKLDCISQVQQVKWEKNKQTNKPQCS